MKHENKNTSSVTSNAENIRSCLIYLRSEVEKLHMPFATKLLQIAIDGLDEEIKIISSKKH